MQEPPKASGPSHELDRKLRPVAKWTAPLVGVRDIPKGQGVGYSHTWLAPRDSLRITADSILAGLYRDAPRVSQGRERDQGRGGELVDRGAVGPVDVHPVQRRGQAGDLELPARARRLVARVRPPLHHRGHLLDVPADISLANAIARAHGYWLDDWASYAGKDAVADQVRVLLVGQDPYPTPGHAHGLCFSVQPTVRPLPFSLRNVYRELREDVGCRIPNNGCLEPWARQGVLMLNTVLTVRAHKANSHHGRGWERFTERMIELVAAKQTPVVFVLWGGQAQKKRVFITQSHHAVVACAHPSPLSVRKFFGCRCFSHINRNLADSLHRVGVEVHVGNHHDVPPTHAFDG